MWMTESIDKPAVSCYCSTYGRPTSMIENCIYWFLQQDYEGLKELVILNDCADQTFIFDHPEVRIINIKKQIIPLGKKFNTNIDLCRYDLLATWDDDDVFLPHRLTYSVANMKNGIFHTSIGYVETGHKEMELSGNYFHSTHLFSRDLFNKTGGYKELDVTSIDTDLMDKFKSLVGDYTTEVDYTDIFYIYRWSETTSHHTSGWGQPNVSELTANRTKGDIESGHIQTGKIYLNPAPIYNYMEYLPIN